MAGFDDGAAQPDGEMRFADARRAKEEDVFGLAEKPRGRQLADEPLIDGRLEFEFEIVERLDRREVRDLQRHRDAGALFGVDFLPQDAVEKVEIGRLAARGVGEHGIEPLGDVAEAETGELLDDAGVDDDAHWPPPATTAA